jgi:exodeoxyribonuclease-3
VPHPRHRPRPQPHHLWDNDRVRIVTWNVNSLPSRMPRLQVWLQVMKPDVLCLQETKIADEQFPYDELAELGYSAAHRGDGRWNGVAILSRVGLEDVVADLPGVSGFPHETDPPEPRFLSAVCGGVQVACVYVPNGRTLDNPHYLYKLRWLSALHRFATGPAAAPRPFAILGDFNVAPHDDDVWDMADFTDSTHVSQPERIAIRELLDLGLTDLPPSISKGRPFTFWDYRGGNFHKGLGMRIDLILANRAFSAAAMDTFIDREARKTGKKGTPPPSDHAPLITDLDL